MVPSAKAVGEMRAAGEDLVVRLTDFFRGQADKLDPGTMAHFFLRRLADDFVAVVDGQSLTHSAFMTLVRKRFGSDRGYRLTVLDSELRQIEDNVWVLAAVVQESIGAGPGAGYVLSIMLADRAGAVKAVHAHATAVPNPEHFVAARLGALRMDLEAMAVLPRDFCEQHACVAIDREGASLRVAMNDPDNTRVLDNLRFLSGYQIAVVKMDRDEILRAVKKHYPADDHN